MDNLLKFQDVLSQFVFRAEEEKKKYDDTIGDLPSIYNKSYLSTQKDIEKEKYNDAMEKLKADFIERVSVTRNNLVRQENKRDAGFIDYQLLEKLNTVASAGIDLSRSEYMNLITECISSGSSICSRKLQSIIADRNLENIRFPSASESIALVDSVADKITSVIQEYEAGESQDSGNYGYAYANRRILDGTWISKENERYGKLTTSDIKNLRGDELKAKLESKIDTSKIDTSESIGKQKAKEYSKRMMMGYNGDHMRESAFIPAPETDD